MTSDRPKPKVTKIKCPSCQGNGLFMGIEGSRCMWCRGSKRLGREDALSFSYLTFSLGFGGYICGDHDLADCRKMEAEANAIRELFGEEPLKV